MKKGNSFTIVLSIVGLCLAGVWLTNVTSGDKNNMDERREKEKKDNKKPESPKKPVENAMTEHLDEIDKGFYQIAKEILRVKRSNAGIDTAQQFLAVFVRKAITEYYEDPQAMARIPQSPKQLIDLMIKFNLYNEYKLFLAYNSSMREISKKSEKDLGVIRSDENCTRRVIFRRRTTPMKLQPSQEE